MIIFTFVLNKLIIYWLFSWTAILTAYSQKLVFENLGVRQGLPAMEVYNVFQDASGYIWVFTEYGIVKHNGSKFVPACRNIPLKESAVYAVAESKSEKLYIANSKARIYEIWKDKAFLVKGLEKYTNEIHGKNQPIISLFFDNQNQLYFSSFYKTYIIPKSHYWVKGKTEANILTTPVNKINTLYPVRLFNPVTDNIFLSIINHYSHSKKIIHRDSIYTSRTSSYESNGNYYLSFKNQIHLYRKDGTTKHYSFDHWILNYKLSNDGHIWLGLAGGGLHELDQELNPLDHYLNDARVSGVLFDNQTGMWVSTIGEGVYYCRNIDQLSFHNIPGLKSQITTLKTIGRKVFIGTASGKLFVKENNRLQEINLEANTGVNDIVEFEGRYYIGTKNQTYVMNANFKLVETIQNTGYAFQKAHDGSLIMLTASGILRRKRNSKSFEILQQNTWNRCVVERNPGEFFVIISKGEALYRLTSTFSCPPYLNRLQEKNISRIKIDAKKNVWICTKGEGLYQLTMANKLIHHNQLPSNIINDVSFLSDDIVLLATNKGAFVSTLNQLKNRTSWHRLLDEEVLRITTAGEEIVIGTTSGLTSLNANKLFGSLKYQFYLSSVETKTKKIQMDQLAHLHYQQNDLYFNYDLLIYSEPSKQLYYKLKGPSTLDGQVEGTQVHLQNLSPGRYTLSVQPHMRMNQENDLKIVTVFYIKPAFWQTSFFLVLVIVAGVVLIILCSWWIMRYKRRKEVQRIQVEKLLAEYRLTALKAQVNPHFMSNSLVAIQELIINHETSKANLYIAKFSMLIRYLLNFSDQSVISLYNELKVVDLYVDLEQLRFSNRFVFIKEIDENIQLDQLFIPALITQPLIENAIWHGLLPLSGARTPTLKLSIMIDKDMLCISISDNGVGRTNQAEQLNKPLAFTESKGMKLITNRIESLNKLYAPANGYIKFIDLTNKEGKPIGSTVQLFFQLDMLNKLYNEKNQEYYR